MLRALMVALLLATPTGAATPIAGEYYQGDGTGLNWTLNLNDDHTFTFKWMGCLGEYGRAAGQWSEEPNVVILSPSSIGELADRLPLSYYVVRWGERTYLIPPRDVPEFCSMVLQGWEPRADPHGSFFLRSGDSDRKADGKPALPARFRSFLIDAPVRAKIISIKGNLATIDAGASEHLRPGMLLHGQTREMAYLEVVSVRDHSAVVNCGRYCTMPPKGSNVSTLIVDPQFEKDLD